MLHFDTKEWNILCCHVPKFYYLFLLPYNYMISSLCFVCVCACATTYTHSYTTYLHSEAQWEELSWILNLCYNGWLLFLMGHWPVRRMSLASSRSKHCKITSAFMEYWGLAPISAAKYLTCMRNHVMHNSQMSVRTHVFLYFKTTPIRSRNLGLMRQALQFIHCEGPTSCCCSLQLVAGVLMWQIFSSSLSFSQY